MKWHPSENDGQSPNLGLINGTRHAPSHVSPRHGSWTESCQSCKITTAVKNANLATAGDEARQMEKTGNMCFWRQPANNPNGRITNLYLVSFSRKSAVERTARKEFYQLEHSWPFIRVEEN